MDIYPVSSTDDQPINRRARKLWASAGFTASTVATGAAFNSPAAFSSHKHLKYAYALALLMLFIFGMALATLAISVREVTAGVARAAKIVMVMTAPVLVVAVAISLISVWALFIPLA